MDIEYLELYVSKAEESYDRLFEQASKLATVIEEYPETDYKAPENLKMKVDFEIPEEYAQLQTRTLTPFTSKKWVEAQTRISSLGDHFSKYRRNTDRDKIPEAEFEELSSRREIINQNQRELSKQLREISTALNRTIDKELSYTKDNLTLKPGRPPKTQQETIELEKEEVDIEPLLEEKEKEIEQKVEKIKKYQDYQNTLLQVKEGVASEKKVGNDLDEELREDQINRAASKIVESWSDLMEEFEQMESSYRDFERDWELYEVGKVARTKIEELYNLEPKRNNFKNIKSKRDRLHSEVRNLTKNLITTRKNLSSDKVEQMNQIEKLTT